MIVVKDFCERPAVTMMLLCLIKPLSTFAGVINKCVAALRVLINSFMVPAQPVDIKRSSAYLFTMCANS